MPNRAVELIRISPEGYNALDTGEYKEIDSIPSKVLYLILEATDSESGGVNLKTMVDLMRTRHGYTFTEISTTYFALKKKGYTQTFIAPYSQTEFYGEEVTKKDTPYHPWDKGRAS